MQEYNKNIYYSSNGQHDRVNSEVWEQFWSRNLGGGGGGMKPIGWSRALISNCTILSIDFGMLIRGRPLYLRYRLWALWNLGVPCPHEVPEIIKQQPLAIPSFPWMLTHTVLRHALKSFASHLKMWSMLFFIIMDGFSGIKLLESFHGKVQ